MSAFFMRSHSGGSDGASPSRSMARLAFGNVIKHAIRNRDGKGGRTLFAVFPVVAGLTGG